MSWLISISVYLCSALMLIGVSLFWVYGIWAFRQARRKVLPLNEQVLPLLLSCMVLGSMARAWWTTYRMFPDAFALPPHAEDPLSGMVIFAMSLITSLVLSGCMAMLIAAFQRDRRARETAHS